uniref:C2H2-type domain-containing protein n=1 Tax=Glossina pallidipes TaxID=7398 RepID=A0A1B0AFK2_GLOPL
MISFLPKISLLHATCVKKSYRDKYRLTDHFRKVHVSKGRKVSDICGGCMSNGNLFERQMLEHDGKPTPELFFFRISTRRPETRLDMVTNVVIDEACAWNNVYKKPIIMIKYGADTLEGLHFIGLLENLFGILQISKPNKEAIGRVFSFGFARRRQPKAAEYVLRPRYFALAYELDRCPKSPISETYDPHTGDILYACQWCPKTFNSNANMHAHRKKVHPKVWEEAQRSRFSEVCDAIKELLNKGQQQECHTRNFLKFLCKTSTLVEVRYSRISPLELWIHNGKLVKFAQELLSYTCFNTCMFSFTATMFQTAPDDYAKHLAEIYKAFLLQRDDCLRTLRVFLRGLVRMLRNDIHLVAFCKVFLNSRPEVNKHIESSEFRDRIPFYCRHNMLVHAAFSFAASKVGEHLFKS